MENRSPVLISRTESGVPTNGRLNGSHRVAPSSDRDETFMRRALHLARRAQGWTSPNPAVGAVIVRGGRIVGQGFHRKAGWPHAEVEALRQAGSAARGATLYVTLEPCNHTGRTPPCCNAIIRAGIAKVVAAMKDPNPITDGRGIARLRRAGIPVSTDILQPDAEALNVPFCKAMRRGLPFVTVKVGQSLDGKIATRTGASRWITSAASRRLVHAYRGEADAILVGINTVLRDDPRLTIRGVRHRMDRPIKIIVDSRLRIPLTARCLSRRPATLIATTVRGGEKRRRLAARGVEVVTLPSRRSRVPLRQLFHLLVRRGMHSVLIEGGGDVIAGALAERLVDRVTFFVAPILIGGRTAPTAVGGEGISRLSRAVRLDDVTARHIGPDLCIEGRVVYPTTVRRFSPLRRLAGSGVERSTGKQGRRQTG